MSARFLGASCGPGVRPALGGLCLGPTVSWKSRQQLNSGVMCLVLHTEVSTDIGGGAVVRRATLFPDAHRRCFLSAHVSRILCAGYVCPGSVLPGGTAAHTAPRALLDGLCPSMQTDGHLRCRQGLVLAFTLQITLK